MKKAVSTGEPINPPIWWVDPLNAQAHKINDGESITYKEKLLLVTRRSFPKFDENFTTL